MEQYSEPERIYNYEYKAVSYSLLDKVFCYWLNYAFKFIPPQLSANLLSMVGNIGSWLALFLMIILGDRVDLPYHRLVFAIAAFSVFFYHTVDNLDGRQAKRAGTSGPLGEFVDHWFDSFNVFFFPLGAIAAFPAIPATWGIAIIVLASLADWLALREVLKTNIMYFGPVSADEGIFVYWALLFAVFFTGYGFWADPHPFLGFAPIILVFLLGGVNFAFQLIKNLIKYRFMGFRELLIELIFFLPIIFWIQTLSPILGERFILITGLLAIGFVGSRHVGDLLRVRLTGLKYPLIYPDLVICTAFMLIITLIQKFWMPLPHWLLLLPMVILYVDFTHALVVQFLKTVRRVNDCLGVTLFGTAQKKPVPIVETVKRK